MTLAAPAGTELMNVTAAASPAELPTGVRLPQGIIGFSLGGVPTGGGVMVQLTVHSGDSPIGYWKFGPTVDDPAPHWYSFAFDGTTGGIVLDSRSVQLQLVDGGRGDSDLTANGVIVDPGGPGGRVSFPLWLPFVGNGAGVEPSELGSSLLWLPLVHSSAE